jgi:hypothetical protein
MGAGTPTGVLNNSTIYATVNAIPESPKKTSIMKAFLRRQLQLPE